MNYTYEISITNITRTPVNIADREAKIVWEKDDSGVNYKKTLSGNFTIYKSGNEGLFDEIMNMNFCDDGLITAINIHSQIVGIGAFNKRDIDYNMDKCSVTIKPRWFDGNQSYIDSVIDEDFNILTWELPPQIVEYTAVHEFEFMTCSRDGVDLSANPAPVFDTMSGTWGGLNAIGEIGLQRDRATCGLFPENQFGDEPTGWTYYGGTTMVVDDVAMIFDITTVWFREVKLMQKTDSATPVPPPQGSSTYAFNFIEEVVVNGITYNKFARLVDGTQFKWVQTSNNADGITWGITDYYGMQGEDSKRTNYRTRRLINILQHFASKLNCTLQSDFFTLEDNPVSHDNLKYLMVGQKSDAIFDDTGYQPTDPATKGVMTMNTLMKQLWSMFQVTWLVDGGILYVEHINYFKSNFQYINSPAVDLDLTVVYPIALDGSYSYSYNKDLPIREKFSFQEAWNIDFIGADIEYTNCLNEGSTISNAADVFTTDLDPIYLDNEASKDGFIMFHCSAPDGISVHHVIVEVGYLSNLSSPNAHLSWANLHQKYWRYNRPLHQGIMNNVLNDFLPPYQRHQKQVPIEFPFCVENFDDPAVTIGDRMCNSLVRTTMGDGEIAKAEYSFKTGNLKIELLYDKEGQA